VEERLGADAQLTDVDDRAAQALVGAGAVPQRLGLLRAEPAAQPVEELALGGTGQELGVGSGSGVAVGGKVRG
jgi:hypothetical protein